MKVFLNKSIILGLFTLLVIGLSVSTGVAGNNLIGNGFPSGPHFNLNIIGKNSDFVCPSLADYVASTPGQNVIYVRRVDSNIEILMESGAKGPKSDPSLTTLKVTDWCSNNIDGSSATLQLPKDAEGYAVYARITGKPGSEDGLPTFAFSGREFVSVEDEFGNDLFLLGLINDTGIYDYAGNELYRYDGSKSGKGVKKAVNITELFQYSGQICAINDQTTFCSADLSLCTPGPIVCCVPFVDDGSGNLVEASSCDPTLVGFGACVNQQEGVCPDSITYNGFTTTNICQVTTQCKYYDDQWIFNIADFVSVLFGAENNGSYNVHLRFYPLPLLNNQTP